MSPFLFVPTTRRANQKALRQEGPMSSGGESVIRTRDLRIMIPSL